MAFFRMRVRRESGGSALMKSWGAVCHLALGQGTGSPPQQPPQLCWGPRCVCLGLPRPTSHPGTHQALLGLTIIWATSSAFREKWKEPACALLQMAWHTMHTLWTRHSCRAGSCGEGQLQGAADAHSVVWLRPDVVTTASAHRAEPSMGGCPQLEEVGPHPLFLRTCQSQQDQRAP